MSKSHFEDHVSLDADVGGVVDAADDLYINHHNGDKPLNKRIMLVRDRAKDVKLKLEKHIENHSGDDAKIKSWNKLMKFIWPISIAILVSLAKHVFDYM